MGCIAINPSANHCVFCCRNARTYRQQRSSPASERPEQHSNTMSIVAGLGRTGRGRCIGSSRFRKASARASRSDLKSGKDPVAAGRPDQGFHAVDLPGISSSHHSKVWTPLNRPEAGFEIFSIPVADHHDAAPGILCHSCGVRKRAVWIRCCRLPGDVSTRECRSFAKKPVT